MTPPLDSLLVPQGSVVLHIGPHKTGTSTLQSALHLARDAAAAHGVHYAGRKRQPIRAAQAAAAGTASAVPAGRRRAWRQLVGEVRSARADRVVISSEWFSDASDEAIRGIARDLEARRLHVVLTVRPLAAILPSQWQQYVQAGLTLAYEPWLEAVLRRPGSVTPGFWVRHRHDELAARWAAVVGPAHTTVVVADERDRGVLLRTFERLLGLPAGLLVPAADRTNRSLTLAEVELIRLMNRSLAAAGISGQDQLRLVLFGAAASLKVRTPGSNERRIRTPAWALEPVAQISRSIADGLRRSGARIAGDVEHLVPSEIVAVDKGDASSGDAPWPGLAATAMLGILRKSGLAVGSRTAQPSLADDPGEPPILSRDRTGSPPIHSTSAEVE